MKLITTILFFLFHFCVYSQVVEDLTGKDELVISPYTTTFKQEVPFILTGIGVGLTSELIRRTSHFEAYSEQGLNSLNRNDVNLFDRSATYNYSISAGSLSDIFRDGVTILPILFLTNKRLRSDIKKLALITVEVVTINWGVTSSLKHLTSRTRPYVYNSGVPLDVRTGPESKLSFFSGHVSHTATVSFLFAKVINDYNPNLSVGAKVGLWGISSLIPATTAYLRVKSGDHFPPDVIIGYGVGATIGWLIPHLHKIETPFQVGGFSYKDAKGVSLNYVF